MNNKRSKPDDELKAVLVVLIIVTLCGLGVIQFVGSLIHVLRGLA